MDLHKANRRLVFDLDGFSGAVFSAGAAAHAVISFNSGNAVNDFDGFDGAVVSAGAAAGALFFINFRGHGM